MDQSLVCGPPQMAYPALTTAMNGYLAAAAVSEMPEYYPPMRAPEEYEGYTETLTRPRLTKEQVETLEAQFQIQPKPSSYVKRQLAMQTNLSLERVANWFQNRRAKAKQQRRQEEFERMQREAREKEEREQKEKESGSSTANDNPSQEVKQEEGQKVSTPQSTSPKTERHTPANSASQPKHQKTPSEVTREKTFESLQRALNAAVAAREQFAAESGIGGRPAETSLEGPTHVPAGIAAQPSVSSSNVSEWPNSQDASIQWNPSGHGPGEAFSFGNVNAASFASPESSLATAPQLESPPNQAMTTLGSDVFGNMAMPQAQSWPAQAQEPSPDNAVHTSEPMQPVMSYAVQNPVGHVSRRPSTIEESGEHEDHAAIPSAPTPQPLQNGTEGLMWRRPNKEVDLAARRKRPRPTAIGTNHAALGLMGPASMSPTTRVPSFGGQQPHVLRHSKSSHALGARYAGVRKISAPQRSPLGFTGYGEACKSATTNGEVQRRLQSSASLGSLAPPTPLTPDDMQQLMPATPADGQPLNMLGAESAPLVPAATTASTMATQALPVTAASPPLTPMPLDVMSPMPYQSLTVTPQFASFPEYAYSPVTCGPMTGVSWTVSTPTLQGFQQLPGYLYNDGDEGDDGDDNKYPSNNSAGKVTASDTTVTTTTAPTDNNTPQFHIHEFPDQREAHRSVAQQLPPQGPRNYTFSNRTLHDF